MSPQSQTAQQTLEDLQHQRAQAKQQRTAVREQETVLSHRIRDLDDSIAVVELLAAYETGGDEAALRHAVTTSAGYGPLGQAASAWLDEAHPGLSWHRFSRRSSVAFRIYVGAEDGSGALDSAARSVSTLGALVHRLMGDCTFVAGMTVDIFAPEERMLLCARTPILTLRLTAEGWELRTYADSSSRGGSVLLGTSGHDCRALVEQARTIALPNSTRA
ncbi:hypothetical protein ACH41H_44760 [Streptomyces sp. NPDC020800]|uniref:hypothetical protein n=1 Tax=Streptomyces sp. NPDC020800 TaxID=3365092 RepID=UPI0037A0AC9A